ncbi:YczE/YyaS/YitT family protein [Halalkalibacter nanhaiisediminis]|uniref:Membrane protein YczE n=1 Tax=Halalkalibacter nanhaiisediminis TaxID=688079 RepID=A0A562QCD4_9BACI|nr:DUF6198 family protein [Halalkalibacter nanhaiisediminis]TWI54437.1 hypothetical protein IQ10_02989 [Halalkalibacter nanhaiisediminis]
MKPVLIRIMSYLGGLLILSFGITLTILAGLGTGAWDALNVGLASMTVYSVGNWVIFIGILLILINALLSKSKPELLALVTVIILGYFIDFWLLVVFDNSLFSGLGLQIVVLLIGAVIIAFGIAVYLQAEFAVIPIDRFMFVLKDLLGVNVMLAKTVAEVIALLAAFLVGGPIGIGTVVVTFLIGPLIQLFYPHVKKRVNWRTAQ